MVAGRRADDWWNSAGIKLQSFDEDSRRFPNLSPISLPPVLSSQRSADKMGFHHGRNRPNRQPSELSMGRVICKAVSILFSLIHRVLCCEWSWTIHLAEKLAREGPVWNDLRCRLALRPHVRPGALINRLHHSFFLLGDWNWRDGGELPVVGIGKILEDAIGDHEVPDSGSKEQKR